MRVNTVCPVLPCLQVWPWDSILSNDMQAEAVYATSGKCHWRKRHDIPPPAPPCWIECGLGLERWNIASYHGPWGRSHMMRLAKKPTKNRVRDGCVLPHQPQNTSLYTVLIRRKNRLRSDSYNWDLRFLQPKVKCKPPPPPGLTDFAHFGVLK